MDNPAIWLIIGGVLTLVGALQFGKTLSKPGGIAYVWLFIALVGMAVVWLAWGPLRS